MGKGEDAKRKLSDAQTVLSTSAVSTAFEMLNRYHFSLQN